MVTHIFKKLLSLLIILSFSIESTGSDLFCQLSTINRKLHTLRPVATGNQYFDHGLQYKNTLEEKIFKAINELSLEGKEHLTQTDIAQKAGIAQSTLSVCKKDNPALKKAIEQATAFRKNRILNTIKELLRKNKKATRKDIAAMSGVNEETIKRYAENAPDVRNGLESVLKTSVRQRILDAIGYYKSRGLRAHMRDIAKKAHVGHATLTRHRQIDALIRDATNEIAPVSMFERISASIESLFEQGIPLTITNIAHHSRISEDTIRTYRDNYPTIENAINQSMPPSSDEKILEAIESLKLSGKRASQIQIAQLAGVTASTVTYIKQKNEEVNGGIKTIAPYSPKDKLMDTVATLRRKNQHTPLKGIAVLAAIDYDTAIKLNTSDKEVQSALHDVLPLSAKRRILNAMDYLSSKQMPLTRKNVAIAGGVSEKTVTSLKRRDTDIRNIFKQPIPVLASNIDTASVPKKKVSIKDFDLIEALLLDMINEARDNLGMDNKEAISMAIFAKKRIAAIRNNFYIDINSDISLRLKNMENTIETLLDTANTYLAVEDDEDNSKSSSAGCLLSLEKINKPYNIRHEDLAILSAINSAV